MKKKNSEIEDDNPNKDYEKLRDELFKYRIEINAFQRSIKTIIACVTLVIAILSYFGYDKIDSVVNKIEQQTNKRLASTDSILSQIDTHYLDSLTLLVEERTALYENALKELERGMEANKELLNVVISNMNYNKRTTRDIKSFTVDNGVGLFDIIQYADELRSGELGECYVVLNDDVVISDDNVFLVEILPKGRNVLVYYQFFEINGRYNKFNYSFSKFEQYDDYILRVALIKKTKSGYVGYCRYNPIRMKK